MNIKKMDKTELQSLGELLISQATIELAIELMGGYSWKYQEISLIKTTYDDNSSSCHKSLVEENRTAERFFVDLESALKILKIHINCQNNDSGEFRHDLFGFYSKRKVTSKTRKNAVSIRIKNGRWSKIGSSHKVEIVHHIFTFTLIK